MEKPANPPAFPCKVIDMEVYRGLMQKGTFSVFEARNLASLRPGMTLADHFAAMALPVLIEDHVVVSARGDILFGTLAERAYDVAFAMLVERQKRGL